MSVSIELDDNQLVVRTTGVDTLLCLARTIRVPRSAIDNARVLPIRQAKKSLGWRMGGGYFPRCFATGWFTIRKPKRRGHRQWWATHRDDEVLVIDTNLKRPARLVLQTGRRHELAQRLRGSLSQ